MTQNLLALAVKPLDVATPLLQAQRMQHMQAETQKAQFENRQNALGSEARGLLPYANHPEFGSRWGEAVDRLAQSGHLDPQRAAQIRNSPSPLVLQQIIASTTSPDLQFRQTEAARDQGNRNRDFGESQTRDRRDFGFRQNESDRTQGNVNRDFGFRQNESTRSQGNTDRTFDENRRQFDVNAARQPPSMWRPTPEGGVAPVPGGTADPAYIGSVQGAQAERAGETVNQQVMARESQAKRLKLDLNDPQVRGWVLTGKQPPEKPPLTAGDHKAILDAETEVTSLDDVLKNLRRAKELIPSAYAGAAGGIRGRIGDSLHDLMVPDIFAAPGKSANTVELNQILGGESIQAMSAALKGATTDKEMGEFKKLMADPNISVEVKQRALDRMLARAEAKRVSLEGRVRQMREGTFFRPGGGVTGTPGGAQPRSTTATTADNPPVPGARKAPDGQWYVERDGQFFRVEQ